MQERSEPRGAYLLERGAYQHRGEQVYPATPAVLPPIVKRVTTKTSLIWQNGWFLLNILSPLE